MLKRSKKITFTRAPGAQTKSVTIADFFTKVASLSLCAVHDLRLSALTDYDVA